MTNIKLEDQSECKDENSLKELFFNIIKNGNITTVFQPIISLRDGAAYGYEALTRGPKDTQMHSPVKLFEYAQRYGKIWELEMLCRLKAFESCSRRSAISEAVLPTNKIKLFLNVNPNIMDDVEFKKGFTKEYIEKFLLNADNIIFEITEREAIDNISAFKKIVQNYKEQDYKIAIDDVGAGYSGLNMISDVHPHFIKLDMNLIRNVDKDVTKESLIKSMCEFASLTNTYLIAEGIETQRELEKLIEIGVHYGQGYFIQKPNASIMPISCNVTKVIHSANSKKNHIIGRISDIYISNICTPIQILDSEMCISEVNEIMNCDYSIPGFCITKNGQLVGVITRNDLHLKLSGLYGYSLNSNKPVNKIMNKNYMRVDYKTPIDIVAKVAMQRENDKLYDFITITKDEKYLGIVTVKDLLQKTIQIEIINAKHLNPLSELPGNVLIEKYLEKCIYSHKDYCVLYFDLDNFKVYNDVYGFEKGDVVLKRLTKILKTNISRDEFVGHIGGDDFIAVLFSTEIDELCNKIIKDFDDAVLKFYNEDDIRKGYIVGKSRKGIEEKFALVSLSIAGVTNKYFKDIYDLSEKASQIKNMCKQYRGSNYIIV